MKRLTALILSTVLVFSLSACGSKEVSSLDASVSLASSVSTEVSTSSISEPEPVVEPVKVDISDFYEHALNDWLSNLEIDPKSMSASFDDTVDDIVFDRLYDLVDGKTVADYPNDSIMQKYLLFYEQLNNEELREKSTEHIISLINEFEKVKTLDGYYELITDPRYSGTEPIFSRNYMYTDRGKYLICFKPSPYAGITYLDEEKEAFLEKELAKQFVIVGFSEEEAKVKASNAVSLNRMILSATLVDDYIYSWSEKDYLESDHVAPLVDFLKKMDYTQVDVLGNSYYEFFVYDSTLEFYDALLTKENLPMIRDFYEANLMTYFFALGSYEMLESDVRIAEGLKGYPLDTIDETVFVEKDNYINSSRSLALIYSIDAGHLAKLYKDAYVSEELIAEADEMVNLVKSKYVEMIKEQTWLSDRVKEKLVLKIKKINVRYGDSEGYSTYEDFEIGNDPIDTLLSFTQSNRTYSKRFLSSDVGLSKDSVDVFSSNGQYSSDSNSVLITFGTLQSLEETMDLSYEEKLGLFGNTLTHEIAHAISPYYIQNGVNGVYMDFVTEEENNAIWNSFYEVANLCEGKKTKNGNDVNGYSGANELFTDILSMDCSLRILEDMESPDYDAFFVDWAKGLAIERTPGYEKTLLESDPHVLGRERVNITLAQFDRFYETYNVDVNSEFYVSTENRITGYINK